MKVDDKVLISPELTHREGIWIPGVVIEVEKNTFVGVVISAKTEDNDVFFGREDQFKPAK